MKKNFLKMNLQLFAEPGEGGNPDPTPPGAEQATEFNLDELTDEQIAAIKEKHSFKTDDDVNDIVKNKHQRWQKDLEKEKNAAAELAKLSEEERQQALINKDKEAFEQEKAEFRKEQLFVEKGKQLTVEGMPSEFAHRITGETAEEILEDVKTFRKEWDEAVEKAVNLRLVQKPTKIGGGSGSLTKEQIMDIKDPVERQKAISENRNLF